MTASRDITVENREIVGPHGSIPVRVYTPGALTGGAHASGAHATDSDAAAPAGAPGFVWNHGGGFVAGDLDMPEADWVSRELAAQGIVVVSVYYHLCDTDVHYPVPSDDVRAAFLWTVEHAFALGIDPELLSLGGGSAGANLAAGVAKRLRDERGPQPRSVFLAYPVLHRHLPEPSEELAAKLELLDETQVFTPEDTDNVIRSFLGSADAEGDHYAVPATGDLRGLQPTFILNSDSDSLRASGEAYASALALAGNDVLVIREQGTTHGHLNHPEDAASRRSVERLASWVQQAPLVGHQHLNDLNPRNDTP